MLLWVLPSSPLQAQATRVAARVDQNRRAILRGNLHPRAQRRYDRGRAEPGLQLGNITLELKRSPDQVAALAALLKQQQDPASPMFHRWLTPEQYADRFGLSQGDIAKVTDWLRSAGLRVIRVARGRDSIAFSGTVQQIEDVLKTEIHYYVVDGRRHYANASEPSVPEALASVVSGFLGLDDFHPSVPKAHPDLLIPQAGMNMLGPGDVATIYDILPLYQKSFDGTGQTLVVAGQVDVDLSDVRTFRTRFNLPPNDPQLILVPGSPDPGSDPGELMEADLDLEWSGAIAPNASILFVYSQDAFFSAQYAIDNALAPVITFSFGVCEQNTPPAFAQILENEALKANAQGITWIASSGDSGAAACENLGGAETAATTGLSVNIPASLPEVTGVGGTKFAEGAGSYWAAQNDTNSNSALGYIPEIAWNDSSLLQAGFEASGGGASVFYPKPFWQLAPGVPNDGQRDVPDIALSASAFHDNYAMVTGGQWVGAGGTSASAPIFAGIAVLLNHYVTSTSAQLRSGLSNINPNLYALAQGVPDVFHDVTSGNNIVACQPGSPDCTGGSFGYTAGPGYDQVTGLGSIDVSNLASNWMALPLLGITNVTSGESAAAGGQFNAVASFKNFGQANAGPFRMGLYLSTSSTFLSDPSPLIWCDYANLAPGDAATCSGSASLPTDMQPGSYYLVAAADVLNQLVQFYQYRSVRLSDSGPLAVQSGACTYSLSDSGVQVEGDGGSSSFTVSTQAGCSWTASSSANWIAVASGASGNGAGAGDAGCSFQPWPRQSGRGQCRGPAVHRRTKWFYGRQCHRAVHQFSGVSGERIGQRDRCGNGERIQRQVLDHPGARDTTGFVSTDPTQPVGHSARRSDGRLLQPRLAARKAATRSTSPIKLGIKPTSFLLSPTPPSAALLMDVNLGLPQENKCNCLAPPGGVNVAFGYYMLLSNSSVDAFPAGSRYSGDSLSFNNFNSSVENQTGIVMLTVNQNP